MADPSYLIDKNGRVALYNMWTHVPTLYSGIVELLARNGEGVVGGGTDRVMHFAAAMTAGWPAIRRGLWQSYLDLETAAPTMATSLWLGNKLRAVVAPITQKEKPLPRFAKLALSAAGLIAAGAILYYRLKPARQAA